VWYNVFDCDPLINPSNTLKQDVLDAVELKKELREKMADL